MRDPNRIPEFCNTLQETWLRYPDFRFGQFMLNFLGEVSSKTKTDPFFIEDYEMIKYLKQYLQKEGE